MIYYQPNAYGFHMEKKSPPFEKVLSELEKIVQHLESGNLPLNEALEKFEKGIQLARQGQMQLEQAEQRIQILLNEDSSSPLAPFEMEE